MAKTSGWVIVASEGATVDGRTITRQWITDMAETYSQDEYTALIWAEHSRSPWGFYDGKNWGTVDKVKAEEKDGRLRLFAQITANQYLLDANKDGQKLFTSIEPNPDFRGTGRCYLMGLAVTDSPASAGTTRLKFSMGSTPVEREYSTLEPFTFINDETTAFERFMDATREFFKKENHRTSQPTKDESLTLEQLQQAVASAVEPFSTRIEQLENKFNQHIAPSNDPTTKDGEKNEGVQPVGEGFAVGDLANVVSAAIAPIMAKVEAIQTQFNALSQEAPNQRPNETGASGHGEKEKMEVV